MYYKLVILIFIICAISSYSLDDVEYYNLQIKEEIPLDYSPEKRIKRKRTYVKYWGQDFVDAADRYLNEKHQEYEAYKKKLEEDLTEDLTDILPPNLEEELLVVVNLDEDPNKIKIIYRYTPVLVSNSQTDFGLEEEQLKLTFKYRKEFQGLENPVFSGIVSFFDYVDRRVDFIF